MQSRGQAEIDSRAFKSLNVLPFGVQFLDDALGGMYPGSLTIFAGRSGVGKTQFCVEVIKANLMLGKKVFYMALEAEWMEIESRLKWSHFANHFFQDPDRPQVSINQRDWMLGRYLDTLSQYEILANENFDEMYSGLKVYYKQNKFDVQDLIDQITFNSESYDLVILDHVHFFDYEGNETETMAIRKIAKTLRQLSIYESKAILAISHIRKPDRYMKSQLAPDLEELHGSSDLYKVATSVITMGRGKTENKDGYETFIRVPKYRLDGNISRFIAQTFYSPKGKGYGDTYNLGWSEATEFEDIGGGAYPPWAKRQATLSSNNPYVSQGPVVNYAHGSRGQEPF